MNQKTPSKFRMWKFHTENKLRWNWRKVIKPFLRKVCFRPICWVKGHDLYEDHYWSGGHQYCRRNCGYHKVLWRPVTQTAKRES